MAQIPDWINGTHSLNFFSGALVGGCSTTKAVALGSCAVTGAERHVLPEVFGFDVPQGRKSVADV